MSKKIEEYTIVVELGPGQHVREDGRIVHTDISGSVLRDEHGDHDGHRDGGGVRGIAALRVRA